MILKFYYFFIVCTFSDRRAEKKGGRGSKKQQNPENGIVYIFINEEIYFVLTHELIFMRYKNVFLCLQLHIQILNVSTMDSVRYVSKPESGAKIFFSLLFFCKNGFMMCI
jgi:hypothetical protein